MANKILVLNMKMYNDYQEIKEYISSLKFEDNVIVIPTSIYIPLFISAYNNVGVQNISQFENGGYTSFLSASQVKSMGVKYAVIGHSEVRRYLNEDDALLNKKIKLALKNNLKVILCVGETKEEKDNNEGYEKVRKELDMALKDIKSPDIIIAYEPIYAIGTLKEASDCDIMNMVRFIREEMHNKGMDLKVIYGGSVSKKNIKHLNTLDIDGFMVGRASTVIDEVRFMMEVVK